MNMRMLSLSSLLLVTGFMQCEESFILLSTKEDEVVEIVSPEQQEEAVVSTVWYKKRSIQIAAAAVACAVGAYAIAVQMDKFASPVALWRTLFVDEFAEQKRIRDLEFDELRRNYELESHARDKELKKNAILLDSLAEALEGAKLMQDKCFRHYLLAREFLWGHDERRKQAEEEFSVMNDFYTETSKKRSTLLVLYNELLKKDHELFIEYINNGRQPVPAPDAVLVQPVAGILERWGLAY